jgi:hypothetical protein
MIQTSRRTLLTGLISFMASPAIVRASSLMSINSRLTAGEGWEWSPYYTAYPTGLFRDLALYGQAIHKISADGRCHDVMSIRIVDLDDALRVWG